MQLNRDNDKIMNKKHILSILLAIVYLMAGCSSNPVPLWEKKGSLIQKYGAQFLKQKMLLDVTRRNSGEYSFLTTRRIILNINFALNQYEVVTAGEKIKKSLAEVESEFKVSSATLAYWATALDELNSFLISKHELNGDLHISGYSEAPLGARSVGWFYFSSKDNAESQLGFARLVQMEDGWYWGITKAH